MKISKNIDGVLWEIEMKTDYKHKSDVVSGVRFAIPLLEFKEHIFPDYIFDTMKKLKPGLEIRKCDIDVEMGDPILSENLILELTQIFNSDPHFPVDIKLLNTDTKQKYRIHFKKDGSSSIQWTHKSEQVPSH